MDDAADDLPLDDGRVDERPAVVDDDIAIHLHGAGTDIDLQLDGMASHSVGQAFRQEGFRRFQARCESLRDCVARRAVDDGSDLAQAQALMRDALDLDHTVNDLQVAGIGLEYMSGDLQHLFPHLKGGEMHRRARRDGLSTGEPAHPVRHRGGIAGEDRNRARVDTKLIGTDLCQCRLEPLAHRRGTAVD